MLCVRRSSQPQAVKPSDSAMLRFQRTSQSPGADLKCQRRSQSQLQVCEARIVAVRRSATQSSSTDDQSDTPQRKVVYLKLVFDSSAPSTSTSTSSAVRVRSKFSGNVSHSADISADDLAAEGSVRTSLDAIVQSTDMATSEYEELKEIGRGSYGTVWLIKQRTDNKKFVLKKIDLKQASAKDRKSAEQESKLLSQLKHPNIVSYRDSYEKDGILHIIMGFCEGGDLYNLLQKEYKVKSLIVDERQIVQWLIQIAMALEYLHDRNILHRDLKTQNIFLIKQQQVIKVGDLGIARVLSNNEDMAKTFTGTPYYMSPELFAQKPYNHKSDVWAFGICVYEMATLDHAFNAKDLNSLAIKVIRGKMPPMPTQYSADLVNLIKAMLHREPEKRPSILRILKDPYIRRNIQMFLDCTKQQQQQQVDTSSPGRESGKPRTSSVTSGSARKTSASSVASSASGAASSQMPKAVSAPRMKLESDSEYPAVNGNVKPRSGDGAAAERKGSNALIVQSPRQSAGAAVPDAYSRARGDKEPYNVDRIVPTPNPNPVRVERVEKAPALTPVSERASEVQKSANVLLIGQAPVAAAAAPIREREVQEKEREGVANVAPGYRARLSSDNDSGISSRAAKVDSAPSSSRVTKPVPQAAPVATAAAIKVSDSCESAISEITAAEKSERMERNEAARARHRRERAFAMNSPRTNDSSRPGTAGAVVHSVAPTRSEENRSSAQLIQNSKRSDSVDGEVVAAVNKRTHTPSVGNGLVESAPEKKGHVRLSSDTSILKLPQSSSNVQVQSSSSGAAEVPAIYNALKNLWVQNQSPNPANNVAASANGSAVDIGVLPSKMQINVHKPTIVSTEPTRKQSVNGSDGASRALQKSSSSSSDSIGEEDAKPLEGARDRRAPSPKSNSSGFSSVSASASKVNDNAQLPNNPRGVLREQKRANREVKNLINALECTVRVLGDETISFKPPSKISTAVVEKTEAKARENNVSSSSNSISHGNGNSNGASDPVQREVSKKQDAPVAVKSGLASEVNDEEEDAMGPVAEETIGRTGRMMQRFQDLRKDIIRAIGYEKLKQSYDILDQIEDEEVEPKLLLLLGQTSYDAYIGKIWQLKFCEEAIYGGR